MSGIPNQEPKAYGLITFKTTFGSIDIELFTQQCPKASRNFVQLCLDNYYKGTLFERVEKDFIAIGGYSSRSDDNELTDSFPDEFHSRLKFTRRGLLATANEGKNENGAKFFFTLGATPELQDKHTIFGRAKGNSVYTLVELNECQVDEECRPFSEQKIEEVIVVENPFQDLVPRLKSNPNHALEGDSSSEEEYYDPLSKSKQDLTKTKKLSFNYGDDDSDSENERATFQKDRLDAQSNLRIGFDQSVRDSEDQKPATKTLNQPVEDIRTSDNEDVGFNGSSQAEKSIDSKEKRLQEIRSQIQAIKKQMENSVAKDNSSKKRTTDDTCRSELEPASAGVDLMSDAKSGKDRQRKTVELVNNFRKKLKQSSTIHKNPQSFRSDDIKSGSDEIDELDKADGDEWLNHKFEPKDDLVELDDTFKQEVYERVSKIDQYERSADSDRSNHNRRSRHHHDSSRSSKSHRY